MTRNQMHQHWTPDSIRNSIFEYLYSPQRTKLTHLHTWIQHARVRVFSSIRYQHESSQPLGAISEQLQSQKHPPPVKTKLVHTWTDERTRRTYDWEFREFPREFSLSPGQFPEDIKLPDTRGILVRATGPEEVGEFAETCELSGQGV